MNNYVARAIRLVAAVLLAASIVSVAGCSEDSPTAEEPAIKTPRSMRIEYVLIVWNALEKPNGDTWDFDPFSETNQRPDIYFKLGNYTTNVLKNFKWTAGSEPGKLSFSAPNYGQMNYDGSYTLQLFDEDGALQGSDDLIGQVKFRPDQFYRNNNAETFNLPFEDSDKFSAYAIGDWIY